MSQRGSGYERKEHDAYETPAWVTSALMPHIPQRLRVWEPAAGSGKMSDVLRAAGHEVWATDIANADSTDFLKTIDRRWSAIITNPPYTLAQEFIEHALECTRLDAGIVAMLLRTDFDHARKRQHLFAACRMFSKKLVLTKRIVWFDGPKAAPSFNHAWYVWDWLQEGPPVLVYGPTAS